MTMVILSLFLVFFFSCHSSSGSFIHDFRALVALKQGFQSLETPLMSWDTSNSSSVCSWVGIFCSGGRVVSLDLTDMNINGSISPEILKLDGLVNLSLAGNNFIGTLELAHLKNLQFLNISNNQFKGGLDWDFATMPNLRIFDAYNNNFSACLPEGIIELENLNHLNLGGNYFFGQIPSIYGKITDLEYLSLAGNDLRGRIPDQIGNLTSLKKLYLGYFNVFEDGIPSAIGNLVSLVHLDLSSCGLDGSIPKAIGRLRNLDTLYMHTNLFSGSIPRELGNLTDLVNLDLSINSLTGEIPLELACLEQLKLLNLFMNRLHGSIPEYISDLPELETLGLWRNNFTGWIPTNLGRNGKLQNLDLSSNKLTGTIPHGLCSANQLKILILMKNFLFGSIPPEMGACYSLIRVRLGENYLNGSIPDGFIFLPELNLVELHDNYLTGRLEENDDETLCASKMVQLDLSNNLLSGSLPRSLSNFSSLQILLLSGNNFTGPIPPSLGPLNQIQKLDLSRNSFSGQIPPEIGSWNHLVYLDLSQNGFTGSIPSEISNIRILNYLNLSRNHLNQTLPMSIASMRSLTIVDFSFNNLSGRLPESGQFTVFNSSSFEGNPSLCGSLLSSPCNLMPVSSSRDGPRDFKLIFALGLLVCSVIFATAAILKAISLKKAGLNSWKLTAFQKLEFQMAEVLECIKDGNVIGRGGAGVVFYGKMPNGVEIAVKKLLGLGPHRHDHGFRAEIQTLGNIRHRNIVRLLAFCSNKDTNLLVYEYMSNGSLGEALHGTRASLLGWNWRYKIAIEAARGLCYLHHDCSPLIIHRDVKSNNILLNSNFEAHVADFGLAKFLIDGGASQCMSAIAGSYGYIAPEYAYTLKVDEKSDVYSFGVVLLELLTGRRPVGDFGDGVDIVQWSKTSTCNRKQEVMLIVDQRLKAVPSNEAMHLFFVAMLCCQENSVERPTMREVVQMLSEFPRSLPESPSSSIALLQNGNIKQHKYV